jgi:nitroimidazol reductase NimA-like FMN-containing flavoprotein (pyridoxamine 5'-phosphate oxidase superfamily)
MKLFDGRTGIEWIERDECLALLAADEIGRLAVTAGGTPLIFPVNYVLDGSAIVFRSAAGFKLNGSRGKACFEIDGFDHGTRRGWSVVAVGRLEEVTRHDGREHSRIASLDVDPWAGGEKEHWLRLVPDRITGRRVP